VHEPDARQAGSELYEIQQAREGVRYLRRRECLVGQDLGEEAEGQQRRPEARGIQQQEREQGAGGRPEHAHPVGGVHEGESDADGDKM
jgi:hypothetical protein